MWIYSFNVLTYCIIKLSFIWGTNSTSQSVEYGFLKDIPTSFWSCKLKYQVNSTWSVIKINVCINYYCLFITVYIIPEKETWNFWESRWQFMYIHVLEGVLEGIRNIQEDVLNHNWRELALNINKISWINLLCDN